MRFEPLALNEPRKILGFSREWWPGRTQRLFFSITVSLALAAVASATAAETWCEALALMPLQVAPKELNRTNCVEIFLGSFQSNSVIKALVFMPGATDEFHLFHRAKAVLVSPEPTLLEAVEALTNQTFIRASFCAPYLLLHTGEDSLSPDNSIQNEGTAQRLSHKVRVNHLECNDRDWDFLQPMLKQRLKIALRPWRYSSNSWHFYRHSFVAWDINGLQALELAAYAGKSKFTLRHGEAIFEVDPRVGPAPKFDAHLH